MPTANPSGDNWKVYGDYPQTPLIPRSQFEELTARFATFDKPGHPNLQYVHDQDGVGQCNCDATVTGGEFVRSVQGLEFVELSAADLYDRINGGSDRGSLLEDATREMVNVGVGTAKTSGKLWKRGYFNGPAPADERALFKMPEVYLCPTFDHLYSASLCGFGIISGVMWYNNYTPDPGTGWLPLIGSGGGGGHAVFGYKPTMRKFGSRTIFGIWHQNSWATTWGLGGQCVFPESMYTGPVGGWWAIRTATDGGGDVPAPRF